MGQLRKRDADMLLATRDMEKSRAEAVEREERRLRRMCRRGGGVPFDWGVLEGIYEQGTPPPAANSSSRLISAGGEGLRPTLLGTLEAHLGASDPLRGGRV